MADTMQVELVSPEKLLASVEAEAVMLPGSDGDFTAMPGHVPTATSLRPGKITLRSGGNSQDYLIAGGFVEVSGSDVSVLAERVVEKENATAEMFEEMRANAEAALENATQETKAEAKRHLDGLNALIAELA